MKLTKNLKRLTAATLTTSLASPVVVAHTGHGADPALHGLLHSEHIIVLAVTATIAIAAYALRHK